MADVRPEPAASAPQPRAVPASSPTPDKPRRSGASSSEMVATGPRYPGFVRMGILIGGSAGLWAVLILGALRLFQR